jgi:hypothetical protein
MDFDIFFMKKIKFYFFLCNLNLIFYIFNFEYLFQFFILNFLNHFFIILIFQIFPHNFVFNISSHVLVMIVQQQQQQQQTYDDCRSNSLCEFETFSLLLNFFAGVGYLKRTRYTKQKQNSDFRFRLSIHATVEEFRDRFLL